MAVYELNFVYTSSGVASYEHKESHIYGGSRVGLVNMADALRETTFSSTFSTQDGIQGFNVISGVTGPAEGFDADHTNGSGHSVYSRILGAKNYELTNHLGNVMSVITDKKLINDTQGFIASAGGDYTFSEDRDLYTYTPGIGTHDFSLSTADDRVDFYTADVVSYSDYYPFGNILDTRSDGNYRYGFNGQEGEEELYGTGNATSAEYWMYDNRLGRRWNVDPVVKPWESSYATFSNNPIYFSDPLGLDSEDPKKGGALVVGAKAALDDVKYEITLDNAVAYGKAMTETEKKEYFVKNAVNSLVKSFVKDEDTNAFFTFMGELEKSVNKLKGKRGESSIGVAWVNDKNKSGAGKGLQDIDIAKPGVKFDEMDGSLIDYVDNAKLTKDFFKMATSVRKKMISGDYKNMTNNEVLKYFYKNMVMPSLKFAKDQIVEDIVKDVIRNGFDDKINSVESAQIIDEAMKNMQFVLDSTVFTRENGSYSSHWYGLRGSSDTTKARKLGDDEYFELKGGIVK